MTQRNTTVDALLKRVRSVRRRSTGSALQLIGQLVDAATDELRKDAVDHALVLCDQLDRRSLAPAEQAALQYRRANAWAAADLVSRSGPADDWCWEAPALEKEILHLRSAITGDGFDALVPALQCSVLTNLGNSLSRFGRHVEALPYWDRALAIDPSFGMAHGNCGIGLEAYARVLYDPGHAVLFLREAEAHLTAAAESPDVLPAAREGFARALQAVRDLRSRADSGRRLSLDRYSLGRSKVRVRGPHLEAAARVPKMTRPPRGGRSCHERQRCGG